MMFIKMSFLSCIGFGLAVGIFCGCAGGGPNKPERKKMPDLASWGPATGTADFPFHTGDIDIQSGSGTVSFLEVALPDPAYDSVAMGLIASYEPFAVPLLTEWAKQAGKCVVIDLRSRPDGSLRADYTIDRPGAFSIPVIFLWDQASAGRAAAFIEVLQTLPSVRCQCTGGRDGGYLTGRKDCFQGGNPGLDGR